MTIDAYIINDISLQPLSSRVGGLQALFNELPHSHLPIGESGVFLGCISENDARCFEKEKPLEDYRYALETFFVHENDSWLSVLEVFAQNRTTLMPVLNESQQYVGYVELNDVLGVFSEVPFLREPGGILVIGKSFRDFSFSEITQIVESNEGKILGLFISRIKDEMAQITLKIASSGMNEIIQSFRRYGYQIVSDHQEDSFQQNLKERSEYLEKYLDI